ncbi:MAG: aldehyde dehydrogenase family protein [Candidatus Thermoplasmatota archaeon]|nr:aldehyde dehydrogenase family protein [Candidatus Thermoplasmatota archaeon]MBS3789642.1 aldehyde dehydrogenase family protein [Candidatus Thermoplasmatota archaeon]
MSKNSNVYLNFIDGAWVESKEGETFKVRNPADLDELIGRFQSSTERDVDNAVKAALTSQKQWDNLSGPERGKVLRKTASIMEGRKDELTETLTREEGKTISEAAGEVQRAIDIFYYYAEKARDLGGEIRSSTKKDRGLYTIKEPLGVVGVITPWNYPIAIPAWKMAPALAVGNTVVVKPASLAPNVCRKLVKFLDEAGMPDGVVNMVTGSGSVVGNTMINHEEIDAISFTGSRKVGESVYRKASESGMRVQTEMGGKNPILIMEDADIGRAVKMVKDGAFGVTGQACTATSRAIVHEDIYDEFVEELEKQASSIEVGPGLKDPDMGPQISEEELKVTMDYIEAGKEEGAELVCGGDVLERDEYSRGFFVEPTVFSEVKPDMKIAREEIFGPVVAVIEAEGYGEAVSIANDVDYGLSASIVTKDLSQAHNFVEDIDSGVVKVNEKTTGLELHVPFGGLKASSSETWREQGDAALDFYTISKTVYLNY